MHVFVINMARSAKRRERMRELLDGMKIEWEFFEAIDGGLMEEASRASSYDDDLCRRVNGRSLTKGEIGCALSHRGVYRRMLDRGIGKAVVLEDDVRLDASFPRVIEAFDDFPFKNEIVLLGMALRHNPVISLWGRRPLLEGFEIVSPKTNIWQAWGYCLDIDAALSMIALHDRVFTAADDWKVIGKGLAMRLLRPYIVGFEESLGTEISSTEARPESISHSPVDSRSRGIRLLSRALSKARRMLLGFLP
jgi:glycosyl transferase family 25